MTARRAFVLMAALGLTLAAVDFSGRIYVGRDESLRVFERPQLSTLTGRPDSTEIRRQLVSWLPGLAGSAGIEASPTDPAGWQLTLIGVFRQGGDEFALLHAQPRGAGSPEIVKVQVGEEVHGSRVLAIEPKLIQLDEAGTTRELLLFERGRPALAASTRVTSHGTDGADFGSPRNDKPVQVDIAAARARMLEKQAAARADREAALKARSEVRQRPARAESVPAAGAVSTTAPSRRVSEAQQLKPGEEAALPFDLPLDEGDGAGTEKKP